MKSEAKPTNNHADPSEQYRRLFETAQDGILILDGNTGKIIDANPFISELTGYSNKELFDKYIWDLGFIKNITANKEKFLELREIGYVRYENLPIETKSREIHNVEFISNSYLVGSNKVIQCNIRDITDRVKVEKLVSELSMMYQVIIHCNQILLHETNVDVLMSQMCKVLVSAGGFRSAWIGCAPQRPDDVVKPMAAEGISDDYFDILNLCNANGLKRSVVATAIYLDEITISQNLKNNEKNKLAHEYDLKHGYSSVAVIPITSKKIPRMF